MNSVFLNKIIPIFLLFLFAFYGAFEWATLFPFYPFADFAGDMLTANKIKDEGYLLFGHWSTWGFNHPGPFWLYYNYFIENCLSLFNLNRLQMWRYGASFISALFILYSAFSLSQFYLKKIDFIYSFVFILLFSLFVDQAGNLWMPWRIVTPFLAFFVSLLHIQKGNFNYIFPAVLFTCILIHGYASMPFFTLGFLFFAFLIGLKKEKNLKKYKNIFIASCLTAFLFALPIFIDHYLHNPSNLTMMFNAQAEMQNKKHPELNVIIYEFFHRFIYKNLAFSNENVFLDYTFLITFLIISLLYLFKNKKNLDLQSNLNLIIFKNFLSHSFSFFLFFILIYITSVIYFWRFTFHPSFYPFLIYSSYYLTALPPVLFLTIITPFYILYQSKIQLKPLWLVLSILLIALIHFQNGLPSVRVHHQIEMVTQKIAQFKNQPQPLAIQLDYLPSAYIHNYLIYDILFKKVFIPSNQPPQNLAKDNASFNNELTWFTLSILEELNQQNIHLCVINHLNLSVPMFTPKHICAYNQKPYFVLTQPEHCYLQKQCLSTTENIGLAIK